VLSANKNIMKHKTIKMHSGGLAIVLDQNSTWLKFPKRSKFWANKLKAEIIGEPIISIDECLLEVKIQSGYFWITYDDFQSSIQLEPQKPEYNEIILNLQSLLNNTT
jgi:hypothetical protein